MQLPHHLPRNCILSVLVACFLVTNLVAAVPSSTTFVESSPRNSVSDPIPELSATSYRSAWSRTTIRLASWIWDCIQPLDDSESGKTIHSDSTPLKQLLAQYGDQLVLRFTVRNEEELRSLEEASELLFLDVWNISADGVDIRVAKDMLPSLLGLLPASLQNAHAPLMQGHELAQAVLDSQPSSKLSHSSRGGLRRTFSPIIDRSGFSSTNVFFDDYQSFEVIGHWMEFLRSLFPSHVQLTSVGTSFEGRSIGALRVGVHPTNDDEPPKPRKTIIVSGGAHAREWISVTTVNYVAYSIITQYGKDPSVTKLLDEVDFLFIPTLNPDGYKHSYESDRLWRKTRQPTSLGFCPGIDLDRSWGFQWDGERTINNPCSESFAGEAPFEAHETSSFSQWAKNETENNNVNFVGFLDLHSYSQEILYPYSYTCDVDPPTEEDLEEVGYGLAKSIMLNSEENYKVMQACEGSVASDGKVLPGFEGGGGSALDWFYQELGVRKSFQIKLRDKGLYGFLVPREYIVPVGEEMLSAVQWFGKELAASAASREEGRKEMDLTALHLHEDQAILYDAEEALL